MANLSQLIESLVQKAINKELIHPSDAIYARNQILGLVKVDSFEEQDSLQLNHPYLSYSKPLQKML